ncbi:MAG: acyl-CoA dehydrogenase [Myxococcales bacterium FL481]|nr:MAG: acyl-CoA dehydrogenase [Myxococcales bacterium FL481]
MSEPAYLKTVASLASDVVAKHAAAVDKQARFPQESIDALGQAGLLGLISDVEVGGQGQGIRAAAEVVEVLAQECGSTAMVLCMHYCGTAVLEQLGPLGVRRDIAAGRHLSTLAFSEMGSRSHFWAPVGSARQVAGGVQLDAKKSWVTTAGRATAYVWSSQPAQGGEASTLWLVPRDTPGVRAGPAYDGLGLRGNDSTSVTAEAAVVPESTRLGPDGGGFGVMMETVLPYFNVMNAACSIGMMEAAVKRSAAHVGSTRYMHLDSSLADLPTVRAYVARMRLQTDQARALWTDTLSAIESGREDTMLRVLETKASAAEAALAVTSTAMRVCGGAAYRREVGVERCFRDAQAASIMAPTTDVLYDFIGKAVCGLPLF